MTYQQFSKKLGLSTASLQRIEMGDQNVTLKTIEQITSRLKCRVSEFLINLGVPIEFFYEFSFHCGSRLINNYDGLAFFQWPINI